MQIEYDVELYGAEKKIQLPFVMGVLADLSGKPSEAPPPVAERKFLDIDVDNFDSRMKAMKPRVAFAVPNTLTGEGNLQVDITFESMEDFSPAAVARKVEPLRKLLETRTQLSNLMTYMDGKTGAEELIGKLLGDPTLLQALGSAPNPAAARAAAPPPVQQAAPVAAAAIAAAEPEMSDLSDMPGMSEPEAPQDTGSSDDTSGADDLDSLLDELN